MATGVAQNVFISASGTGTLVISGQGIPGTGILVNNTNAFKLTITRGCRMRVACIYTASELHPESRHSNLFTVGGTVALGGNALTVNGTGDTLISSTVSGMGSVSDLIKEGSGTLTLSGFNSYSGGTAVTGGTLLVNNTGGSGTGQWAAALDWWKKVDEAHALTLQDRRDFVGAALNVGETRIAAQQVEILLAQRTGPEPHDILLAGQVAARQSDPVLALDYAERALADKRTKPYDILQTGNAHTIDHDRQFSS